MNSFRDNDLSRELRAELRAGLVPFDPALAQQMIDTAIAATLDDEHSRARWAMPLLASGAVAAVVGGIAGVSTLSSGSNEVGPGGGATPHKMPTPSITACVPPTSAATDPFESSGSGTPPYSAKTPPAKSHPTPPPTKSTGPAATTPTVISTTIEASRPANQPPSATVRTGPVPVPLVCSTNVPPSPH